MKRKRNPLTGCFVVIMIIMVLFVIWYVPAVGKIRFEIEDAGKSLKTSKGRELKQEHEYNQTLAEIPLIQDELDTIAPLAEAAEKEKEELKQERKALRSEKKKLEEELSSSAVTEGAGNE